MSNVESININTYKAQLREQLDKYEVGYAAKETVMSIVNVAPMIVYYDVRTAAASLYLVNEAILAPEDNKSRKERINSNMPSVLDTLRQQMYFGNSINPKSINPKRYDARPKHEYIEDSNMAASVLSLYRNLERKFDKGELPLKGRE